MLRVCCIYSESLQIQLSGSKPNSEKNIWKIFSNGYVMIAESVIKFFCYYFTDDLTEITWCLLFSSFHGCVAFLMS